MPSPKLHKPSGRNSQLRLVSDRRRAKRVKVSMRGAICPGSGKAELIKTINISEGGVCIRYRGDANLRPGSKVNLQLHGILSSGPQRDLDIYRMQVVYRGGNSLGLRFGHSVQG